MHGTHVGRGAPAWAAVSTGHCAGPGQMPGTGVGAPKALGRAQQGRHSSELKGHLAERGGPVGLEAERVGCPGAVAGAVPGDPGEARTTCLGVVPLWGPEVPGLTPTLLAQGPP